MEVYTTTHITSQTFYILVRECHTRETRKKELPFRTLAQRVSAGDSTDHQEKWFRRYFPERLWTVSRKRSQKLQSYKAQVAFRNCIPTIDHDLTCLSPLTLGSTYVLNFQCTYLFMEGERVSFRKGKKKNQVYLKFVLTLNVWIKKIYEENAWCERYGKEEIKEDTFRGESAGLGHFSVCIFFFLASR